MSKWIIAILCISTGISISAIAGYVSVYGMVLIFSSHATIVSLMIGSVELGKVTASMWLKMYWDDYTVPKIHKFYLIVAVIVSMCLTSMGMYGFLSAAHLESANPLANVSLQASGLERQIEQKNGEIKRLENRVSLIDKNVESFLNADHAQSGLNASRSLKKERENIQNQINAGYADVNALNDKLLPLKQKGNEVEQKLGPIKYFSSGLGLSDSESAVRIVIGMIMVVFDPLAIVLMISGLITLNNIRSAKKEPVTQEPVVEEPEDRFAEQITSFNGALVDIEVPTFDDRVEGVSTNLLEEPEPEPEPEATFDIVHNLHDRVEMLDQEEEKQEMEEEESKDNFIQGQTAKEIDTLDHRERLIQLLQSEPDFLKEVEEVIEELANERVEREAHKIKAGLEDQEYNRTNGIDH